MRAKYSTEEEVEVITVYKWDCPGCDRPQSSKREPTKDSELCYKCADEERKRKLREFQRTFLMKNKHLDGAKVIGMRPAMAGDYIYFHSVTVQCEDGRRFKIEVDGDLLRLNKTTEVDAIQADIERECIRKMYEQAGQDVPEVYR